MGNRNTSIVIFLILTAAAALLFQNCSQISKVAALASAPASAKSGAAKTTNADVNPLAEMMNYSEQQIRDTRQKLEKRSDLFGEERLEALKVGGARVPATNEEQVEPVLPKAELTEDEDFESLESNKRETPVTQSGSSN